MSSSSSEYLPVKYNKEIAKLINDKKLPTLKAT